MRVVGTNSALRCPLLQVRDACGPRLSLYDIADVMEDLSPVSYQCHMNCDEWRQKVNKDRKEKVNLTAPI